MSAPLVEVHGLKKYFPKGRQFVHAVDDVSLTVAPGETLGIVGESGSGKSTLVRLIVGLLKPTAGQILYDDRDSTRLRGAELKAYRRQVAMVFQSPASSLPPHMPVGAAIAEPMRIQGIGDRASRRAEAARLLNLVGVGSTFADNWPHQFSGGQQQRIAIARALILKPRLLALDEPVSALDVSIQAQIIRLLQDLQREFKLTYLFVSHNLAVVEQVSTRVCVMYLGKIMEISPTEDLFRRPLHPYTRTLMAAVPRLDGDSADELPVLSGEIPSPLNPPSGCPFHTRCPLAQERCRIEVPAVREVAPNRFAACHFV